MRQIQARAEADLEHASRGAKDGQAHLVFDDRTVACAVNQARMHEAAVAFHAAARPLAR